MRTSALGLFIALLASTAGARAADDRCWQTAFEAIRHSAAAPRPTFTSYAEQEHLIVDGVSMEDVFYDITYRDDGIALIDDRWSRPWVSNRLEPGPPLLGPYGADRKNWLGMPGIDLPYPTIATVRSHPSEPCSMLGAEPYDGISTIHITFPDAPTDRPALKAMWIDPQTGDIMKLVVSGRVNVRANRSDRTAHYADFQIELEHKGAYTVVRHVTWSYSLRVYSQVAKFFGEYYYRNYRFSDRSPNALLAGGG